MKDMAFMRKRFTDPLPRSRKRNYIEIEPISFNNDAASAAPDDATRSFT